MCQHRIVYKPKGSVIEVPDGNFDPPIRFTLAEGIHVCEKCREIPRVVGPLGIALELIFAEVLFLAVVGLVYLWLGGCAPVAAPPIYTGNPGEEVDIPIGIESWDTSRSTATVNLFPPESKREATPEPEGYGTWASD